MTFAASRPAIALAALAAASMTATPAFARDHYRGDWGRHHHDDGIDGGDLLAGLLIIGGIAAIASAASKADKADRAEPAPRPYPGGPDYNSPEPYRYTDTPDQPGANGDRGAYQEQGSFDGAVDACASELERGERRIGTVDTVGRMGDRFNVEGRLEDGRGFACSVDQLGRIRSVAVDGHGVI